MQVRVTPTGVLDKNTDIKYVGRGNYVDAENIRHRDNDLDNTNASVGILKGNTLAVTIPDLLPQTKTYRVKIKNTGNYAGSGTLLGENTILLEDPSFRLTSLVSQNVNDGTTQIYNGLFPQLNAINPGTFTNITPGNLVVTKDEVATNPDAIRNLFSVNITLNFCTLVASFNYGPGVLNGDRIKYTTTGTTIGGLTPGNIYFTRDLGGGINFALYNTRVDAITDTNRIDLTSVGTGTHTFTRILDREAYFDVQDTGTLDASYTFLSTTFANSFSFVDIQLIQDAVSLQEEFFVIGSLEVEKDTFIISTTDSTPYGAFQNVYYNEIGYLAYNEGSGVHTYTRLIRSKDLGFRPNYRVSGTGEKTTKLTSLYLTDGNTLPRTFYFNNPYTQDGALVVNGGRYNISTIDEETRLFQNTLDAKINFVQVKENTGILTCGNKRYTGYFLTEGDVPSEYLYPTGPIAIYPKTSTSHIEIQGGDYNTRTNKSVVLDITNIPPGVYNYFVLVCIEFQGDSFSIKKVQTYNLSNLDTTLRIEHTGFGDLNETVLLEDVVKLYSKYTKVETLEIFANRMIASNLTEAIDEDLSDWASAITHTLEQKLINSVGLMGTNFTNSVPDYKFGEYQDVDNIYNFTSYMFNDTYRFGVQLKWKDSGRWSSPYWVDDIRFDTLSYNIINDPTVSRRTANNIDTNLTQGATGSNLDPDVTLKTKAYYVRFGNINLAHVLPNGKTLRESISAIKFVRAERIPEVLSTGIFINGSGSNAPNVLRPYSFPRGTWAGLTTYQNPAFNPLSDGDKVLFYLSPDIYYGQHQYEYQAGDKIKLMGSFFMNASDTGVDQISGNALYPGAAGIQSYNDHTGFFANQTGVKIAYQDWTPTHSVELTGVGEFLLSTFKVSKHMLVASSVRDCTHAFLFSTPIRTNVINGLNDNAMYYGQIFRDLGADKKYPVDKKQTLYYGTGHFQEVDNYTANIITADVFGGDVYTQKTHTKLWIADQKGAVSGFGAGFYSQNTTNTQLPTIEEHTLTDSGPGYKFPQYLDSTQTLISYSTGTWGNGILYWLQTWDSVYNQFKYNGGYNISNDQTANVGYDETSTYDGRKSATVIWSQPKLIGGKVDGYRIFMPKDFTDLYMTNGAIVHHEVVNNAVYVWQERSFMRMFFNEGALINPTQGSDIVLGTAAFAGPPANEISSIGCDKKWNIVRGNTIGGKDAVYWYNGILKKIVRFGQDGVRVLSDETISSYLTRDINYFADLNNHLTNQGIHAGWNNKYNEAVFTFKSYNKTIPNWITSNTYVVGNYVFADLTTNLHASGLPYAYVCKANHTSAAGNRPGTGANWTDFWTQIIPGTDNYTHTCITLVYDELKNGFITRWTAWPNMFYASRNSLYSVDPLNRNRIYLHDNGGYGSFFGTTYPAYVESVMNYDANMSKNFEAIQVSSEITPFQVNFATKQHASNNSNADFELREELYYAPIRNTGVPTNDTSRLWGSYIKTKITFQGGIYQKLFNYIIKFRPMPRLYNQ